MELQRKVNELEREALRAARMAEDMEAEKENRQIEANRQWVDQAMKERAAYIQGLEAKVRELE